MDDNKKAQAHSTHPTSCIMLQGHFHTSSGIHACFGGGGCARACGPVRSTLTLVCLVTTPETFQRSGHDAPPLPPVTKRRGPSKDHRRSIGKTASRKGVDLHSCYREYKRRGYWQAWVIIKTRKPQSFFSELLPPNL